MGPTNRFCQDRNTSPLGTIGILFDVAFGVGLVGMLQVIEVDGSAVRIILRPPKPESIGCQFRNYTMGCPDKIAGVTMHLGEMCLLM